MQDPMMDTKSTV